MWKNCTFLIGLALLLLGAGYAPDWDIGISFVMAGFAYLTAEYSLRAVIARDVRKLPLAAFFTWWTVDGCYWLYWSLVDVHALEMRDVNWPASLCLYIACGLVWSAPELAKVVRNALTDSAKAA